MKKDQSGLLLHKAISWGASIVIIGALFKILHIGGVFGNYAIGIGLGVEAFLFFITGFVPPAKDPAWERVYPELADDYTGPVGQRRAVAVSSAPPMTAALDQMLSNAKIGPELIESLGTGLRTFGDKVAAISNMTDVSASTNQLNEKLKAASQSYDKLTVTFEKASASLLELGNTDSSNKAYHEQVNNLAKNLSSLNAVYELELQDSSAHLKAMNRFYGSLSQTMENFTGSLDDSKRFQEEVSKLSRNLSSLNAIYGNMLVAMNQPKV